MFFIILQFLDLINQIDIATLTGESRRYLLYYARLQKLKYEDKDLFEQTILQASNELNIPPAIVEKDYYITQMLKQLIAEDSYLSSVISYGNKS